MHARCGHCFVAGCLALAAGLPLGAAELPAGRVEQLIRELGSARFRQREAAARELKRVGQSALPALRHAATAAADAEVRRRAVGLLEVLDRKRTADEIAAIKNSKLRPAQKGRKLRAFLVPGAQRTRVYEWLGPPASYLCFDSSTDEFYPAYDLTVNYDRYGVVLSVMTGNER
jgi:hypothetical protein